MIIGLKCWEINADDRLAGKMIAVKLGIKPGVTKANKLKTGQGSRNLDTQDLWPKFEDEEVALKLALTGAIEDQLFPRMK